MQIVIISLSAIAIILIIAYHALKKYINEDN